MQEIAHQDFVRLYMDLYLPNHYPLTKEQVASNDKTNCSLNFEMTNSPNLRSSKQLEWVCHFR